MEQVFGNRVEPRSLQKLGPRHIITQLGSQHTNFVKNEKVSEKDLNPWPYKPVPGVLITILHRISEQYLSLVTYIKDWDQEIVFPRPRERRAHTCIKWR